MKELRCYVATRFSNKEVVNSITSELRHFGIDCIQSWPLEHESCTPREAAIRDIKEINRSDFLLLYTHGCPSVPGGMHFEAGYALGKRKAVFVVGPAVQVFCEHPRVTRYDTLDDFIHHGIHELRKRFDMRLMLRSLLP